jgi:glutathione S-transferase
VKLLFQPRSPFVRKVWAAAHELGLEGRIERVPADPWDPPPELAALNPLAKVPVLVTDRGEALYDSRVILAYLDHLAGRPVLYPPGDGRFAVLRREALADGLTEAALACVYETRRRPQERSVGWVARQQARIRRTLAAFEGEAAALGQGPTADRIALGCALGYLDLRLDQLEWREDRPALASWYEACAARPAMRASAPPPD